MINMAIVAMIPVPEIQPKREALMNASKGVRLMKPVILSQKGGIVKRSSDVDECSGEQNHANRDMYSMPGSQQPPGCCEGIYLAA